MNGPTVDCGKAPVEFRGLCLRLSAMALKTKNGGKKKKKRGQDFYFSFSFPACTSIRAFVSHVFCAFSWGAVVC